MITVLTALAGGFGAAARFLVDTLVARHSRLSVPLGTLVVNVSSCFLLGLVTGWLVGHTPGSPLVAILGVGLLGGYSTFSTASVEGVRLIREGRPWSALVHAGGMLAGSLVASVLGLALTM
ncbi:fluoride efflux transporter FluC [Georgenia alba]|uniref:Fluoride-specific ion channel FluC n=1 Tax=Georgenia alba TaxID=2233858 RepID=A0ABW2Q4J9_9MICO